MNEEPIDLDDHENCGEDCEYCRAQARKRDAERYCDAQVAYYAPGGFFDTIFDGAFDAKERP